MIQREYIIKFTQKCNPAAGRQLDILPQKQSDCFAHKIV
jgi:hypothetical protein